MKGAVLRHAAIVASLALLAPVTMASSVGFSARALLAEDEILKVRISPDGEWLVATATAGGKAGLMAQRYGGGEIRVIHATRSGAQSIDWVGPNTVLATFGSGEIRYFLRVDLLRGWRREFSHRKTPFRMMGHLVHPLPLSDGEVLWAFQQRGRSRVYRVPFDELAHPEALGRVVRSSGALGERVASIRGVVDHWVVDGHGVPRAAWRRDDGGHTLLFRPVGEDEFVEIASHGDGERDLLKPIAFTPDGRNLFVTSYGGGNTVGLFEYDPRERRLLRTVYQRDDVDLDHVHFDPITRNVISVQFDLGSETQQHYLDESQVDFAPKLGPRDPPIESIRVVSSDADRDRFVYWTTGPTEPGAHYLRSAALDETTMIGQKASDIPRERLRPLETFRVPSTDDLTIEVLLTLPDGVVDRGHPLVVIPHGGPIGIHDRQRFDPIVQYLASWGFAVLQANYRGSGGYGEDFLQAGRRQWARGIEDDVAAAIDATRSRPEIDGSRVCILGGSYGGFSAITSALRDPGAFRCTGTINGVTDVPLMFESSDFADSRVALDLFEDFVGDVETERPSLEAISPVYRIDALETPLLVVYGDADRRVDPDHAHRLLALLALYDKPHREIRIAGGRHSLTRDQWVDLLPRIRAFLTDHLMPEAAFVPDPISEDDAPTNREEAASPISEQQAP